MARKRKAAGNENDNFTSPAKRSVSPGSKKGARTCDSTSIRPIPTSQSLSPYRAWPVLLVTTGSLVKRTHNVMTMGFHMVIQHESPPLIGISLGPWDASFAALKKQRECVVAIPSVEMAEVVVDIGNCSKDDEELKGSSKWERFGLEALPARKVKAPLVGGEHVIANIECVVEDAKLVSKYGMWVLKPVKAWINSKKKPGEGGKIFHHRGDGTFVVDGEVLDLKNRMVKWQEFQD